MLFKSHKKVPEKSFNKTKIFMPLLREINALEHWASSLKKEDFIKITAELSEEYQKHKKLDALIPKAFALTREAAFRTLGERMFDAQILGGMVLHQGRIAEMKTGEGKTLTSTTAAYLNCLTGNPVHMVTVNDYLAKRDALWMRPIFEYLGKTTSYIISDQDNDVRRTMYSKDIIYATNNELGFDYLRDNLRTQKEAICSRGYHYCIIDEIDSVLIDEARTPLIISGPSIDDTKQYANANTVVPFLNECKKDENTKEYPDDENLLEGDYKLNKKNKSASFTHEGIAKIEKILSQKKYIIGDLNSLENFEYLHYVTQCLRAHKLFVINIDYIISDEHKIEIVDEFTGRVLHGRRYSDGLHQAIEAKEKITIARQNRTLATITFQNFFRMYTKLSGMTGTAATEEKEFLKIYGLDVVELATNRPIIRKDKNDLIFVDEKTKLDAIAKEVQRVYTKRQPILIGTASIENSEKLARLLIKKSVPCNVLNAKNHEKEASIIGAAGQSGAVTIATNMAGRGTDIKLGGHLDMRISRRIDEETTLEEAQTIRTEENKMWEADYEKVKSLGGLYVLGTERHESRRIDNQLRGRSGRQGDAGETLFYLSLDDQLMQLFGGGLQRLKSLMSKGLDDGEPLYHPLITKTMERAQKNVESRNFDIRKHLLDFDSVLNKQRTTIYKQREEILLTKTLILRIYDNLEVLLLQDGKNANTEEETKDALTCVKEKLMYLEPLPDVSNARAIYKSLKNDIAEKISLVGEETFTEIIRMEYLQLIDMRWQDHIEDLDNLRQAVYLRNYAQKNPLLEYSLEGFDLFNTMLESITLAILRIITGLRAKNIHVENNSRHHIDENLLKIQHKDFSLFPPQNTVQASRQAPTQGSNQFNNQNRQDFSKPPGARVIHTNTKVGRNEPCPCGSGKKYKFCCGKLDK